jgi:hypothetical protein
VNVIFNQLRAFGSHFLIVMQLTQQRLRPGKPVCIEGTVESYLTRGYFLKMERKPKMRVGRNTLDYPLKHS